MPPIDVLVSSDVELSTRARQVCGMFDCPPSEKQTQRWTMNVPIDERDWNVGLIVGPSGAGKSTIARHLFGEQMQAFDAMSWKGASMIDDMPAAASIEQIATMCSAVGFNTIPAWLRPFAVLSNGEKFRASIARALLSEASPIVVDEFTSVVDRQVAQVGCHAIQKAVRKVGRKFVGVSCHHDIIEWLQPDWILEPATREFAWRSLRPRPTIDIAVARLPYSAWQVFAPFHYLTADLNRSAQCFGLWANGSLAAFAGVLHRPHARNDRIKGISRIVTLPDWQGLGLAFNLMQTVASAYKTLGYTINISTAHPPLIQAFFAKQDWRCVRKPGQMIRFGTNSMMRKQAIRDGDASKRAGRPCATFTYEGATMPTSEAMALIGR